MIETRALLGSAWCDRKKILAIVKIVSGHPDHVRTDEIVVLTLDLTTGTTEELVFNTKKDDFPWTKLRRM